MAESAFVVQCDIGDLNVCVQFPVKLRCGFTLEAMDVAVQFQLESDQRADLTPALPKVCYTSLKLRAQVTELL